MRFIPITNSSYSAIVDDEDYESIIQLNTTWRLGSKGQSIVSTKFFATRRGNKSSIILSRFIMNLQYVSYPLVDHKYGDIFDNRKSFLRKCSSSQNGANRPVFKRSKSGHKNIRIFKTKGGETRYRVRVRRKGVLHYSGKVYSDLNEAIKASNELTTKLHGNFKMFNK